MIAQTIYIVYIINLAYSDKWVEIMKIDKFTKKILIKLKKVIKKRKIIGSNKWYQQTDSSFSMILYKFKLLFVEEKKL